MNQFPAISVIIITYRHAAYIRQAIESVLMQQYAGPVEIIVSNDCSPDDSDAVVKHLLNEFPIAENFTVYYTRHETNLGMLANLRWALQQATGTYIAHCEGDDYWSDPLKLQKQIRLLEDRPDVVFTFHPASKYYQTSGLSESAEPLEERYYTAKEILRNWIVLTPSVMFRKDGLDEKLFERLCNENYIYADIIMHLSVAQHGRLYALSEAMAVYRIHDAGFMTLYAENWERNGWRFLNHHKAMSQDFDRKYSKINYRLMAEQYLRFFYAPGMRNDRLRHLHRYLQYQFKAGNFDAPTIKTMGMALLSLLKHG